MTPLTNRSKNVNMIIEQGGSDLQNPSKASNTERRRKSVKDCQRRRPLLTNVFKSGTMIDEALKTYGSSASSVRENSASNSSLFSYKELVSAYKSVRKGNKKKPQLLPDYRNATLLDDHELTLLGQFDKYRDIKIIKIYDALLNNKFKLSPYNAFTVAKKNKKDRRALMAPCPEDRIIYTALLNKIKKYFLFLNSCNILGLGLGSQLDKMDNCLQKIGKAISNHKYFIKLDIKDFFPSINREILIIKLRQQGIGSNELNLIKQSFSCGISFKLNDDKKYFSNYIKNIGIPQGCAFSPLLANFYFYDIDKMLNDRRITHFRYFDDILILIDKPNQKDTITKLIKDSAYRKLYLTMNHKKMSDGKTDQEIEFLGIKFYKEKRFIPDKSLENIQEHILNHAYKGNDLLEIGNIYKHIREAIYGWGQYYSKVTKEDYERKKSKINDTLTLIYLKNFSPKFIAKHIGDKRIYLQ